MKDQEERDLVRKIVESSMKKIHGFYKDVIVKDYETILSNNPKCVEIALSADASLAITFFTNVLLNILDIVDEKEHFEVTSKILNDLLASVNTSIDMIKKQKAMH